jgi:hypothetical protein
MDIERRILVSLLCACLLLLVVMVAGCAPRADSLSSGAGGALDSAATLGTDTGASTAGSTTTDPVVQVSGEGVRQAKTELAQALGISATDVEQSPTFPSSNQADLVLSWAGGTADVDSSTGRIYSVLVKQVAGNAATVSMTEEGLGYQALQMAAKLGWTKAMLDALGFRQEQQGTLLGDGSSYALTWTQYDEDGIRSGGRVEVELESRTAALLGFSVSLGPRGLNLAGSISQEQAMNIAQNEIYLKTSKPKLALAGDGTLLLSGMTESGVLRMVNDHKITKNKPVLMWVITILGTADSQPVGGVVYVNATSGAVASYQPVTSGSN